jgi:membrane fusion protein (multidrug efflux system)
LKIGNPAIISIDVCSGSTFKGKIESMGVAAASQFSLLPADNMGGNFIKVTQRVPVRISIDNHNGLLNQKDGPQLLPGTSVEVRVKIKKG